MFKFLSSHFYWGNWKDFFSEVQYCVVQCVNFEFRIRDKTCCLADINNVDVIVFG